MYGHLVTCVALVIVCNAITVNAIKCYVFDDKGITGSEVSQTDIDCATHKRSDYLFVGIDLRLNDKKFESCASMTEKVDWRNGTSKLLT